jgi:WD40 repeat protein
MRILRTLNGHVEKVTAIAFSPEGKGLVTGSVDRSVRLWDLATGKEMKKLGLADRVQRAVFSPDGSHGRRGRYSQALGLDYGPGVDDS